MYDNSTLNNYLWAHYTPPVSKKEKEINDLINSYPEMQRRSEETEKSIIVCIENAWITKWLSEFGECKEYFSLKCHFSDNLPF